MAINGQLPVIKALLSASALLLIACGGASSDEPKVAEETSEATTDAAATGALAEMTLGNPEASLTIIEYASVTCPACANFHEAVFPEIKEKYIDTGKVHFIFREFPTAPANLSYAGSMLARCAADKNGTDAYFRMLKALFKTQMTWVRSDDTRGELLKIAGQAGMSETDVDACLNREDLFEHLKQTVSTAQEKYDIRSTPSFVLNGNVRHFSTTESFSAAIDEALEKTAE